MSNDVLKDHVEHVRGVHFSLMLICFALLVASYLDADAVLSRALRQLAEIQSLQQRWEKALPARAIQKERDRLLGVTAADQVQGKYWIRLPGDGSLLGMWYVGSIDWYADYGQKLAYPDTLSAPFPSAALALVPSNDRELAGYIIQLLEARDGVEVFSTLEEFERLWNQWQRVTVHQLIPREGKTVDVEEINEALTRGYQNIYSTRPAELHNSPPPSKTTQWCILLPDVGLLVGQSRLSCVWRDPAPLGSKKKDKSVSVHFGVENNPTQVELQLILTKAYGLSWSPGPFSRTFPELASVTSNIRDVRLERLSAVLLDLQRHRSETVQIFGTNVPVEQIGRWGAGAIAMVQLYLLLHLGALLRVSADGAQELADAPWIGLYKGRMAKWATVVTTLALPMIVDARFLWLAWLDDRTWDLGLVAGLALATIILGVLTLRQLRVIWGLADAAIRSGHSSKGPTIEVRDSTAGSAIQQHIDGPKAETT